MNIARLLLSGLLATALVAGCGSDASNGNETTKSALAGCATGSTTNARCQACFESKCKPELKECYGTDYTGGACKKLIECSRDSEDPCNASCNPDADCSGCLRDTLMGCFRKSCPDECADSIVKGTCADLAECCKIITVPSAKTGCEGIATGGNEETCWGYYGSVRAFCG
jgi:hypothetical protein